MSELYNHFRDAMSSLADLSSYVGAGIGDDNTTADEYHERIRWGIDHLVSATIQRCADVVEKESLHPARASFGTIKRAILNLDVAAGQDVGPSGPAA